MQGFQKSFVKQINGLEIRCFLNSHEISINVCLEGKQLQCRFNNDLMNNELKQIFNNIQSFYQCFRKICMEWTVDNQYILLDEYNVLEIAYTLKVMKVQIKKKILLRTHPRLIKTREESSNNETNSNNIQEIIQTAKSIKDIRNIIQYLYQQRKVDHQIIETLTIQNQALKSVLKTFQYQIYNLNLKNNENTRNFNQVAHLSSKNFEMLGSYVGEIKVKIQQKIQKDLITLQKDTKSNKNHIDSMRTQNHHYFQKTQQQLALLSNKIYIPPTKFSFIPNSKTPFFNRFKIQDNIAKLLISKKTQFVGAQSFPSMGIYYFNVRNVSILNNQINVGVLAQSRSMEEFSNFDEKCINYYGGSGSINNKGNDMLVGRPFERKQVMTVVVDMNEGIIRWLINNKQIGSAQMRQLRKEAIVPYIELMSKDSKIQLAN